MLIFVADIISNQFLAVGPDTSVQEAIQIMYEKQQSSIVVVQEDNLLGILTERDAVGLLLESFNGTSWRDLPVKHVMTSPVVAVCDDCTIFEALAITRQGKIRHVPVVNTEGKVAGILSQGNMLLAMYEYYKEGY